MINKIPKSPKMKMEKMPYNINMIYVCNDAFYCQTFRGNNLNSKEHLPSRKGTGRMPATPY